MLRRLHTFNITVSVLSFTTRDDILFFSIAFKVFYLFRIKFILLFLGVSLLGRLMDTVDLYQRIDNKFNPLVLTKLVANFRSHPAILKVPNELFYERDLIVKFSLLTKMSCVTSNFF